MHFSNPLNSSAPRRILLALALASLAACTTTPPPKPKAGSNGSAAAPSPAPQAAPSPPPPPPLKPAYVRPAAGDTITRFDGKRNKGIDIAGTAGDPVVSTADGRVVIVSNALPGYGTMIIVKHDETYISAYAHLGRTLVKEKEFVRQGQQIGEMGKSGTDRVKLHFEMRRQGVAVNPEPFLDGRVR